MIYGKGEPESQPLYLESWKYLPRSHAVCTPLKPAEDRNSSYMMNWCGKDNVQTIIFGYGVLHNMSMAHVQNYHTQVNYAQLLINVTHEIYGCVPWD